MSETRPTRIGRYKFARDRSDAIKNIKLMEEYDTEKLRRLEKLDKMIKAGYAIQKLSSLLTKVHRYWMRSVPTRATFRCYLPA